MLEIKLPINPIVPGMTIIIQHPEVIKEKNIPPERDLRKAYSYLIDVFLKKQSPLSCSKVNLEFTISSFRCLDQVQRMERISFIIPCLKRLLNGAQIERLTVNSVKNAKDMGILIKIEEVTE